jgi:hypothetical protein
LPIGVRRSVASVPTILSWIPVNLLWPFFVPVFLAKEC